MRSPRGLLLAHNVRGHLCAQTVVLYLLTPLVVLYAISPCTFIPRSRFARLRVYNRLYFTFIDLSLGSGFPKRMTYLSNVYN